MIYQDRPIHVAGWAKRFLFDSGQLDRPIASLSGGEQARVLIARLMLQPADLLLLDEPTNDLDIPTLEVLEESLTEFPGALVLVTHDRYLLDRVSTVVLGARRPGRGGDLRRLLAVGGRANPRGCRSPAKEAAPTARAPAGSGIEEEALLSGSPRMGADGSADSGGRERTGEHCKRKCNRPKWFRTACGCTPVTKGCKRRRPAWRSCTPAGRTWKRSNSARLRRWGGL